MECKQGYRGPLCAVCNDGYFQSIKDCVRCEKPKVDVMVALVAIVLALLCTCLHFVSQYRRYLARVNAFARKSSLQNAHRTSRSNHLRLHSSDLKVLVSFVTVALTLNTQFHIAWPAKFAAFLDALSVLSMDFGTIFSFGCVVDISFYQVWNKS
jgi:hypothetical protein